MNPMGFKTISGEEVVANVEHIGDDFIQADNCVVLQRVQHPETGQTMQAFGDWPALAKPKQLQRIPITAICVMPFEVHEELEREYVKNVTGLELPPATPKILLS